MAGTLGLPAVAAAQPPDHGPRVDDDGPDVRSTLVDGLPVAESPEAEIGAREGPAAGPDDGPSVASEVDVALDQGGHGATVPVIVRLRDQADLSVVAAEARTAGDQGGHAARVGAVVDSLRAEAALSQTVVRRLLDAEQAAGRAANVRSFWIFNGFSATVTRDALDRLAAHPDVESIALDEEVTLPEPAPASEPRLPTWGLERVNATDVWGELGFTGEGVVVGLMDSGVDGTHPALAGRYRGRDGDHGHSWFAATGENYPTPGDGNGHGTHVAGTIVGGPPGQVVGVAPGAEWIAVKIFNDSGSTSTSIIHSGFEWMLAPGGEPAMAPNVVNNSWGSAATNNPEFWVDVNAWVAAGIFPNFAAGNNGPAPATTGSPGSFPQSFAVGATDINDQLAAFSSRGPVVWDGVEYIKPQVSAPGHEIFSTWPRNLDPDGYETISGTSMATPHVTGTIALLLSAQPDLSVDAIRDLLITTARHETHMGEAPNNEYGAGIVDARAAIVAARFSGTLTGTVAGPDGPIAATVAVPDLGLTTTSDPGTGFYELRLPEGTWTLEVGAYGWVSSHAEVTVVPGDVLVRDFVLDRAGVHTVSGTVSSDGEPIPDAVVRAAGTPLAPVYTDTGGGFAVDVAAGTYAISAEATGYERTTETVTVDGDETIDLALERVDLGSAPDWAEFRNNPQRTGYSPEALAPESLTQSWQVDLAGRAMFSSPVIADGSIYLPTDNGQLTSLDLDDGTTRWTFAAGPNLRGTPAVADGRVYLGGGDSGVFYALDAGTGQPLWTYPTGDRLTYATPTVVDGRVYFGTGWGEGNGGWVYALDAATGALVWRTFIGAQIYFAPAVGGGRVYAGSYDARRLVALDLATGAEVWALTRAADSFAAMPTYHDGTRYVGTNDFATGIGSILAVVTATGSLRWEASGHGDAAGIAPIAYDDLVIAGSNANNWVAAYDRATGEREWVTPAGSAVSNSQLLVDGAVVGGSQLDHRAWALDAYTGDLRWEVTLGDNVLSAPALADGRLVVAVRNGEVTAFEAPGSVTGTVTNEDGEPLGATVRVAETGAATATDPATGRFALDHRPGTYTVEVYSYGFKPFTRHVTVRSGRTATVDAALVPGAAGSLSGTITDEAGTAIPGVEVALSDTPLDPVATGPDGSYRFDEVIEGTYQLRATLGGYVPFTAPVTVEAGAAATFDVELLKYQIAVTGDYRGELTRLLAASGYRTESTTVAAIAERPGDYELIVANGAQDDPGEAAFEAFVANADAAGTSVIFLDTWGIGYGSLLHLSRYLGDPPTTGSGFGDGEVSVIARADHPLTAGLTPGTRIPLLAPDTEYAWFTGYGGRSVADLYVGDQGVAGSAIAYRPTSSGSVHVLLASHGVSPWTGPTYGWQPAARQIFTNAVGYAIGARFGTVAGTVTDADGGSPLAATVTVVETGETTTAAVDGTYSLLVAPGPYTLRFERLGYSPQDTVVTVAAGETTTADAALVPSGLGAIAGTVTSAGQPVAAATVTVVGTELSAITGPDGAFSVDNVPGGTYRITVGADGYVTSTVDGVEVVDGQVTSIDVDLLRSLRVAVIGDSRDVIDNELTTLLNAHEMIATPTGWEAIDQLAQYDLVVVHNPTDPGETAFLDALDRIDAAGVSAIFIEGALTSEGGVRLLRKYLGNPTTRDFVSNDGDPYYDALDPSHPLFDGVSDPAQILVGDEWGGFFTGYTGFKIADFGTSDLGVVGIGAAYEPRTPTSVRLLLSGLSVSILASPSEGWTEDGVRVFLNALQWAARPGMGAAQGRVTDAAGNSVAGVTATVVETGVAVEGAADGTFTLTHPPGAFTVRVEAYGYVTGEVPVTFTANQTDEVSIELALGEVGAIAGTVADRASGAPIAGATVRLAGFPRTAVTDDAGRFELANVEPGTFTVRADAAGHASQLFHDVEVSAGATTRLDVALRESPRVAVIDDFEGRARAYLAEWGYLAEPLTWTDTDRLGAYELVIANLATFPRVDPGAAGWAAFEDAANRAHVPIIWLDQFGRGSIRYLAQYDGDPEVRGESRNDGPVEARILAEHPLVAGFDEGDHVPLTASEAEYGFFTGYSGQTVANVVTRDRGERGGTVAYRGRTAESVDILLSTLSLSIYGYPSIGGQPGLNWMPGAEVLFQNAVAWALDHPPLAGEVRGTVTTSATGAPIASTVRLVETGETFTGRAGDGTFLVPLQPGTWTLEVSAFGHDTATETVTVDAGDAAELDVELAAHATAEIRGRVTDAAGAPVAAVGLSLVDTPLATTSGPDGTYGITGVPVGTYTLRVQAAGYGVQEFDVDLAPGQTLVVDVTLAPSQVVAVAGDYQNAITTLLTGNGYEVRQWNWADIDDHIPQLGEVALVVLNGNGSDPTAAELNAFLDAAPQAGVSVILAGQWGNGAIRDARTARNDPSIVEDDFTDDGVGITYRPTAEHPIFDGFTVGEPVVLMRHPTGAGQQWEWFGGYSGTTIAALGDEAAGDLGGGVGYKFTSPSSVEVLLDSLMSSIYGRPGERWTPAAEDIYLNAVEWAVGATQAQITGTVTSDGAPVAGAEVMAVEAGARTVTSGDGAYRLGVADGTHTVRVTAFGFEPFEASVTVGEGETATLDVDLLRVDRGAIGGTVVDVDGNRVAGAAVRLTGPQSGETVSDSNGSFAFGDLVPGDYTLEATAPHYLPAEVEVAVAAGEPTPLTVTLTPNDVAVLGDADGVLTDLLRRHGEAVEEIEWDSAAAEAGRYGVVVVNGGRPTDEQFDELVAAADSLETSLIFTGTWGVDNGGIRLLERFGDGVVTVGSQGYRQGAVGVTGFDPAHPLFAGIEHPAELLAADSYWSDLAAFVGPYLADLVVEDHAGELGVAAAYDFRTATSLHLLLSIGGASGLIGPGYGWTADAERMLVNAVTWAADAEQAPPAAPTLATEADPIVATPTVTLTGTAEFRATVTITRDGVPVATVAPERDGTFGVEVPLVEGPNRFVASASNPAGPSPPSSEVTVVRDTTGPALSWTPNDHSGYFEPVAVVSGTAVDLYAGTVEVEVNGVPVTFDGAGRFTTRVDLVQGQNTITVAATDALGNKTTEARTVRLFPFDTSWQVAGDRGRGTINAFLQILDAGGRPVQVREAILEIRDATGVVVRAEPMRWQPTARRYHASVQGLPPGMFSIGATLDVEGWRVVTTYGVVPR